MSKTVKNKTVKNKTVKNKTVKNKSVKNKSVKNKSVKNKSVNLYILENKSINKNLNREIIKKNTINNIINSLDTVKPNLHKKFKQNKNITNKYFKKYIITKKNLKDLAYWKKKEKFYAYKQGKGSAFGSGTSIHEEVNYCIKLMIKEPRIFIDVGSSEGNYSNEVLTRYPNIETYMFEPSKAFKELYNNSFKKMKNIHIEYLALSNKTGKQILYSNNYGSQLASLYKRHLFHYNIEFDKTEKIKTMRFDEYWKKTDIYKKNPNSIIDYVKLDVEGHELYVLEGFGDIIYNIGLIQFGFGGTNIDSRTFFKDFWVFFKYKDFNIYRIAPNNLVQITSYKENDEYFLTTNFIAVNNKINKLNYFKNVKY